MKSKYKEFGKLIYFITILLISFLLITCKKKDADKIITIPILTTSPITNITENSATCGGNISSDGGSTIIARGVCWNQYGAPTIADNVTNDGAGIGEFTSNITGISNGPYYFVRAYATNNVGTSYGNIQSFNSIAIPTLSTSSDFTEVTGNSAYGNGNLLNNGGGNILERGLCWSTNQNPTISDNRNNDFTDQMTNLSPNTLYYVRAYATNSRGTGYGNQVELHSGYLYGTNFGGGLVFYNDGTGHGLVCANIDQSTGATWGCPGTLFWGNPEIGYGSTNTNSIVSFCSTAGIAAKICYLLVRSGYSDWFLPSDNELRTMWENLYNHGLGNFSQDDYWSSNGEAYNLARSIGFFPMMVIGSDLRTDTKYVRAARMF